MSSSANSTFINCLMYGNRVIAGAGTSLAGNANGGAIYHNATSGNLKVINCTISTNSVVSSATSRGAAIFQNSHTAAICLNNIIWGNTGASEVYQFFSGGYSMSNSIVQGGFSGTNVLNANPFFTDPANDDFTFEGAWSPGIDSGTSTSAPSVDLLENQRDSRRDMGPSSTRSSVPKSSSTHRMFTMRSW